jgi:hypothetical protein
MEIALKLVLHKATKNTNKGIRKNKGLPYIFTMYIKVKQTKNKSSDQTKQKKRRKIACVVQKTNLELVTTT